MGMLLTASSLTLRPTGTINPDVPGLNHKNGGRGAQRCKAEKGSVVGETGPVWGRREILARAFWGSVCLYWWILVTPFGLFAR